MIEQIFFFLQNFVSICYLRGTFAKSNANVAAFKAATPPFEH